MKWTKNQKVIAEVISKHRRDNGYDLNACLKELPQTSRGTISKVFTGLKTNNWVIPSKPPKPEEIGESDMKSEGNGGTETQTTRANSQSYSIKDDHPGLKSLDALKQIRACYIYALKRGYRRDLLSWLSLVSLDFWNGRGTDPYKEMGILGPISEPD